VLVLFDHGTPKGLAHLLTGHTVQTAQSRSWDTLSNGELLAAAEDAGFEVLLTPTGESVISRPEGPPRRARRPDGQHEVVAGSPP
jgi:hypothetical protein